jgi:hypothetical protein
MMKIESIESNISAIYSDTQGHNSYKMYISDYVQIMFQCLVSPFFNWICFGNNYFKSFSNKIHFFLKNVHNQEYFMKYVPMFINVNE